MKSNVPFWNKLPTKNHVGLKIFFVGGFSQKEGDTIKEQ